MSDPIRPMDLFGHEKPSRIVHVCQTGRGHIVSPRSEFFSRSFSLQQDPVLADRLIGALWMSTPRWKWKQPSIH